MTARPDHWDAMVAACRAVEPCHAAAEDAAGAVVAELVSNATLDVAGPGLKLTASRRRAIDNVRAVSARRCREDAAERSRALLVPAGDPAEAVAERDEARWLVAELQTRLPGRSRRLLDLIAAGYDHDEAAADLGISRKGVHSMLARIRTTALELRASSWRGLAPVVGWFTARRLTTSGLAVVGGGVALGVTALVVVPHLPGSHPPDVPRTQAPPAQADGRTTPASMPHVTTPAAGRQPAALPATRVVSRQAARGSTRRDVVSVPVTDDRHVSVVHGETGGGESGPVEVLVACLEDLEVSTSKVGCSG